MCLSSANKSCGKISGSFGRIGIAIPRRYLADQTCPIPQCTPLGANRSRWISTKLQLLPEGNSIFPNLCGLLYLPSLGTGFLGRFETLAHPSRPHADVMRTSKEPGLPVPCGPPKAHTPFPWVARPDVELSFHDSVSVSHAPCRVFKAARCLPFLHKILALLETWDI